MRCTPWLVLIILLVATGCPLEPLRISSVGANDALKPASLAGAPVAVRVPGLTSEDATGLQALLNGVPVPIVSTRDGEVVVRLPAGSNTERAQFELWRHGEQIVSRDIAAQVASSVGLTDSAHPLSPPPQGLNAYGSDRSSLVGDINIAITVPNGTGSPTTTVISGDSGGGGGGGGATPTPTPTATVSATPTPTPTPTAQPTPTPTPTLVPVADQTPVPNGTGEVQGDVAF